MATLARSDSAKSSSPRIAAAVISSTLALVPVWSASISITSPVISVESTSNTISRFARRAMPTRSTAMSTPATAPTSTTADRSFSSSGASTDSSSPVTG